MAKAKLLVVDDEESIREILQFNLENEGYIIDTAASGEEALARISDEHQLILLDVMMGGISGFHVAEKLRKENVQIPIVFLTAKGTENDLLTGFSVGGDDYISKPFSIKEVIARVKAILRREQPGINTVRKDVIEICGLKLNLISKELEIKGQSIPITKTEYELLHLLMQNPQKVFTRIEILKSVWPDQSYVLERTVDVHVARLRKKLNEYSACIYNRSGYGYSFNDSAILAHNEN
ncbi:MAG: response regulator transcription factor [Candidatus Symbiothrix sp.]|jgi:DNA-binding response OmpR family regulator|nr:response regulator transcription factor [Candidatus Symbiothrix sp.]